MVIQVNGETKQFDDEMTLSALVDHLNLPPQRIAIELNHDVVRRADWDRTILKNEDHLEIVHFVGGGSGFSSAPKSV